MGSSVFDRTMAFQGRRDTGGSTALEGHRTKSLSFAPGNGRKSLQMRNHISTFENWLELFRNPTLRKWALVCLISATTGCHLFPVGDRGPSDDRLQGSGLTKATKFEQNELSPEQAAEACIVTAEELERAGHRREAVAMYQRARQHAPEQIDYSRRLAVLYDQLGNAAKARAEYRAAIQRNPKNADLLNDGGYFHLRQGDLPAAESSFRKAIEQAPTHERAWTNLGIALARQGRYEEAYDSFARVVGPAAAHSNVGAIMAKQGHIQQAQAAFQQALALNPNLQQPQAFLGYFEQQGQTTVSSRVSSDLH